MKCSKSFVFEAVVSTGLLLGLASFAFLDKNNAVSPSPIQHVLPSSILKRRLQETGHENDIKIFSAFQDTPSARRRDILETWEHATVVANTTQQQYEFLQANPCVDGAAERFQLLIKSNRTNLAEELWKYCALWQHGGAYLDAESHILQPSALKELVTNEGMVKHGMAVVMDSFAPESIHGSLFLMRNAKSKVALEMANLIVKTDVSLLTNSPLLLPQTLHVLIQANSGEGWHLLQQSCSENPFLQQSEAYQEVTEDESTHYLYTCSRASGLCCFVFSGSEDGRAALLGSRKPLHPIQRVSFRDLPTPLQRASIINEELPFIATLQLKEVPTHPGGQQEEEEQPFRTFYEQLHDRECLPSQSCNKCLADKKHGATCDTCLEACPCFCKALCEEEKDPRAADSLRYHDMRVFIPLYSRDPTRLIPRIVHQTWFETLDPNKYPNMSRLAQSFKTSGWTYKFYTDDVAGAFLSEHFPPQVREAYDVLIPGAFKADLFRYCCLLVHGGVYSDVDVLSGPSLDAAIPPDVGFVVGLDEPGKKLGKRMCLWNGFIASAPGHPFLAKVIERTVNSIHQRFTSVDVARAHCPLPEMSIITSFSPLFVAGPCMLGSTINKLLGHHGQAPFEAGELSVSNANIKVPGRTIILNQNKLDMGAHRFTSLEQNLIVLSTDFPDSDDREKLDGIEHYSETRIRFTIYGIDGVYKDHKRNSTALIRVKVE